MIRVLWITFLLTTLSCSHVNENSKDHYKTIKLRHGVVPVQAKSNTPKTAFQIIDTKAAKRGKAVYVQNCLTCHGAKGYGDGPESNGSNSRPKNLVWLAETVPNFKFYILASQWMGDMPGWKNVLTDKELRDLEHYIRSLAKAH